MSLIAILKTAGYKVFHIEKWIFVIFKIYLRNSEKNV